MVYDLSFHCRILAENAVKQVNKKIFHGLVNLKTLSLYSNQIRCVTPGAFDALVSLQSLNLIANPFNCNCHMAWFADWLRTKGFTTGGPRCAFPAHLQDRPIHALPSHEFRCTGKSCSLQTWAAYLRVQKVEISGFFCHSDLCEINLEAKKLRFRPNEHL